MPLLACRDRDYRSEQDGEELEVLNYAAKQPGLQVPQCLKPQDLPKTQTWILKYLTWIYSMIGWFETCQSRRILAIANGFRVRVWFVKYRC